jgi:hypothetical protein
MPYGQGQMLGAGVDPQMFVQDYSGFTRAAEIQARGMQNLGTMIGQGIKDFGEARQERKKIDAEIKATSAGIESAIKMGKDLGIDIGGYLSPIQAKINDPNTSPAEALALGRTAAQGISNAFTLGVGAQERSIASQRARDENAFRLANLEVAQQRANIYGQKAQSEESKLTKGTLSFFDPDTNQSEEMDVNYDPQGRPRVIGTGELIVDPVKFKYGEGGVEKLPEQNIPSTSQVDYNQLPSDGNWGFTSKTRDQLQKSTAQARQVSLDFNAAASKNAKGIEIIIPNDASKIERMAAEDYVQQTQKYFADRGVDVPVRGVRTARENGRGTPGRFHTEPFFVGDTAARKVMESDPDGYAQVLANTLGKINNVTFIAPHKTNDPGASDGKFNERDFAKGSIIPALERLSRGDLSRQAMGTPEQQAEVSRMIEQGSGMATSQATPSGSMSTEPSLAQQQPQLPARRQVVATRPVGGGAASSKFRPANAEEVSMYGTQGQVNVETGEFKPIRPPSGVSLRQLPGGGFEFVQGAGAVDRFAQASKEAEKQKLQAADRNIQDLMEVKRRYSSVMQSKGIIPAAARKLEANTWGTELYTIQNDLLKQFQSRLGLEQLTELRMASPSGAAVGNPTNEEGIRLQSKFGSLDATASPEIFKRNINRAIEDYLDTIHGTPEQREKLIEEGKITAKQNAQIEAQYPSSTMDTMGIEQPRQTDGTGNPLIDEIKKRNNL